MTRFRILLVAVAVLGVALLSSFITEAQLAQGHAHGVTIERAYNDWVEAANAKDLNRWASFMAPDPLFLPPNHPPLRGEHAVREYYTRSFADSRFSLNCRQQRVEVAKAEDMAWSAGICEATFTGPDGEPARGSSKWAKVWVRMPDGSWKCTLNSWSSNGPSEGGV